MIFGNISLILSKRKFFVKLFVDVVDKMLYISNKRLCNYLPMFRTQKLLIRGEFLLVVILVGRKFPLPLQNTRLRYSTLRKNYVIHIFILLITNSKSTCEGISNVDICGRRSVFGAFTAP
jgi:hypothetical protein